MNKRQKKIISNFAMIFIVTAGFIFMMMGFKDHVNKKEALRTMNLLSEFILTYREQNRHLPSMETVSDYRKQIKDARLGNLHYRALWIHRNDTEDTILAYSRKKFRSYIPSGYVVLWLSGEVEWVSPGEFEPVLEKQQSDAEAELLMQSGVSE